MRALGRAAVICASARFAKAARAPTSCHRQRAAASSRIVFRLLSPSRLCTGSPLQPPGGAKAHARLRASVRRASAQRRRVGRRRLRRGRPRRPPAPDRPQRPRHRAPRPAAACRHGPRAAAACSSRPRSSPRCRVRSRRPTTLEAVRQSFGWPCATSRAGRAGPTRQPPGPTTRTASPARASSLRGERERGQGRPGRAREAFEARWPARRAPCRAPSPTLILAGSRLMADVVKTPLNRVVW